MFTLIFFKYTAYCILCILYSLNKPKKKRSCKGTAKNNLPKKSALQSGQDKNHKNRYIPTLKYSASQTFE